MLAAVYFQEAENSRRDPKFRADIKCESLEIYDISFQCFSMKERDIFSIC